MTVRPALSTPRPLPRKREHAEKRDSLAHTGAGPARASNDSIDGSRLSPAKPYRDEGSRAAAQPDHIQMNEGEAFRLPTLARIERLREQIRELVDAVAHAADIELLNVMRDERGSMSRYRSAEDARGWASDAGRQLEVGLMMLDRAARPAEM